MRYDVGPLEWAAGGKLHESHGQPAPDLGLALALGVDRQTVCRMRVHGLSVRQADRFAIHLGYHPSILWPSWFDDYEDEARDKERRAEWWKRLNRYRRSVEVPELVDEVA